MDLTSSISTNTIDKIKQIVKSTRVQAMLKLNAESIQMYFDIGNELAEHIDQNDGSKNIVEEASFALIEEFGKGKGYGIRNLKYCIKFYRETKDDDEVQQSVALVPWGHICLILDKIKDRKERLFYLNLTIKDQLGREVLAFHIKQDVYGKNAEIIPSNFTLTLGEEKGELLNEIVNNEVAINIIGAQKILKERDLENTIIGDIKNFLLQLGEGFTYIGNQHSFIDDGEEYRTDLLFYNRKEQALFAIELKLGKFKPEYISKMQWYLHLLNTQMKEPHENDAIGIILCGSKNDYQVKTLLEDVKAPIGVATYKLVSKVEKGLSELLPNTD